MEEALLAWFDEYGGDLPWRKTRDPYAILVSEVMLQQTQVERVVPRYLSWLERWPSVEALAPRLRSQRLLSSGYFPTDADVLAGFTHVRRITREGWAADHYERT